MHTINVTFRFYEELNDFLPAEKRKISFSHSVIGTPALKDVIESLGVPHTEVDLILVNGVSVDFSHQLKAGDQVSVYPVFEALDIASVTRLRPQPLREPRFILDVHLGKLARYLRLFGFDTVYDTQYVDADIIRRGVEDKRIILTRDVGLLKNKIVTHGYWLRATDPRQQIREIIQRFDLAGKCKPFSRCLECNGIIVAIEQPGGADREKIPEQVWKEQHDFFRCDSCQRVFWQGSHYDKLAAFVAGVLGRKDK